MKSLIKYSFFIMALLAWGCGQKSHDHDHEHGHDHKHPDEFGPNQALYDEVMKVHDEVMPKMGNLYRLKKDLEKKIAEAPTMAEENKKSIEATIAKLDSADRGMRDWMHRMHKFDPVADSLGEEKTREYLEDEMKNVKKVKEDILEAIEKAKGVVGNP